MRLYGRRFWAGLALGAGPLLVILVLSALSRTAGLVFLATGGALVFTACYVVATLLAAEARPGRRTLLTAVVTGVLVFAPVPFLTISLVFPGLIWLAFFGLAVPVALREEQGLRESIRRSIALARADFVHVLGSMAALVIVGFISAATLAFLLGQFGEQTRDFCGLDPARPRLAAPLPGLCAALRRSSRASPASTRVVRANLERSPACRPTSCCRT